MQKNLLIDCTIFGLQRHGGVSNYVARFVDFLDNNPHGFCVTLLLPSKIIYEPRINFSNFKVVIDKTDARISQYRTIDVNDRFDWVFSPYYRALKHHSQSRLICTVHDFSYERFRYGLPRWIHMFVKNRALKSSTKVICISQSVKNDLYSFYPHYKGLSVTVIPHGVDGTVFSPHHRNYHDRKQLDSILYVGLRKGYKRFDLAVQAIAKVPHKNLLIVGPDLTQKEKQLLDKFVPKRWTFLGHVSNDVLCELYSNVHSFIFPSEGEGFGMPVLEAAMCGCPVITSNLGGLAEFAQKRISIATKHQIPQEYADLIKRISENKDPLTDVCYDFSWENSFRQTLKLLSRET